MDSKTRTQKTKRKSYLKIIDENLQPQGLDILAEFTLGERTELVMDTPNAYADQKSQDEAIKTLTSDPMLIDYLDELATIDEKVNATDRFTELLISVEKTLDVLSL